MMTRKLYPTGALGCLAVVPQDRTKINRVGIPFGVPVPFVCR